MKLQDDISTEIYEFQKEIRYYSQMQLLAIYPFHKAYYESLIKARTEELINFMKYEGNRTFERQQEFTLEDLSTYDGTGGRAAYVAVDGIVYDVSNEATWGGGTHFGLYAGKDLSSSFMGCHKGMSEILNKLPKVGVLKK